LPIALLRDVLTLFRNAPGLIQRKFQLAYPLLNRAARPGSSSAFPSGGASTCFLGIIDLTDVGLSRTLCPRFGFFGLLHAVSASRPCGWGGHDQRGPEQQRFHVLHSIREGLGLPCYTGSLVSVRRATLDDPDSTACRFGPSLEQPRMAGFSVTMLVGI